MAIDKPVRIDGKYRTVSGKDVRIYAVDAGGKYPVHGAVRSSGEWGKESWTGFGINVEGESCTYDLVEMPDPPAFDTTKQWMRRGDGRRPDKIELTGDGFIRYWIDGFFCIVDSFGHYGFHDCPRDLIPYVAKMRPWTLADVLGCDGIAFDGVGFVDWKSLAADWRHSIDGGKTWAGCEVPA